MTYLHMISRVRILLMKSQVLLKRMSNSAQFSQVSFSQYTSTIFTFECVSSIPQHLLSRHHLLFLHHHLHHHLHLPPLKVCLQFLHVTHSVDSLKTCFQSFLRCQKYITTDNFYSCYTNSTSSDVVDVYYSYTNDILLQRAKRFFFVNISDNKN